MDVKEETLHGGSLDDHWYYRSKRLAMDSALSRIPFTRVLDIGAGSGIFSRHLVMRGAGAAVCVDPAYPTAERCESIDGRLIRYARDLGPYNADLVLLMDVLEHVEDDVGLIRSSLKGAAPGAHVLITVPAFQFLFSAHDRFLEHKRRYTIRSLETVVETAGLEIVSTRYFFALVLPIAAAHRLLQRDAQPRSNLTRHSSVVNSFLTFIHRAELSFFRYNRFGGLSIFCLARAP